MTIVAVIPARGGSKKLPGKNIKLLLGKPLIAWTIEAALDCNAIDDVLVSSDDEEILAVAARYDGVTPVQRPAELAQDASPTLPVLQHAVQWYEWSKESEVDIVTHLPCTNPLKTAADIAGAIRTIESNTLLQSVIGVHEIPSQHPLRVKRMIESTNYLRDFYAPEPKDGQRQLLRPKAYLRNGAFYIVRRNALMPPNGKLFDHEWSYGYEMPDERSVNIDNQVDFDLCEILLKRRGM